MAIFPIGAILGLGVIVGLVALGVYLFVNRK